MSDRFAIGDLVTRDGTDLQRVISTDEDGIMITVVCIEAPRTPWCEVGDEETNLARRYGLVAPADHAAVRALEPR